MERPIYIAEPKSHESTEPNMHGRLMMNDILIIDDDPAINSLFATIVKRIGHRAHIAETGRQGLQAIQNAHYDLVLLDLGLPDGNGMQLLTQIRQTNDPPEVIIITGNGHDDIAELAIKNGARDCLVKPTTLADLKLKIERALAHGHNKTALPQPSVCATTTDSDDPTKSIPLAKHKDQWVPLSSYRDQMDRRYLANLLLTTKGCRKEACRISGLSRTRLFELLKKHGLNHPSLQPTAAISCRP